MDFLKKLIEAKEEVALIESATETFEMEGEDHEDYGRISVSVWSFTLSDIDTEREHHEERVDVDDYRTTPDYTEAKDGKVINIKAYVDIGGDVGTFIVSFNTDFWSNEYVYCFDDRKLPFDVSQLKDYSFVDEQTQQPVEQTLDPEQEEFIVRIVKNHLAKVMSGVLKNALCSVGRVEPDYD